jgi:putative transposase
LVNRKRVYRLSCFEGLRVPPSPLRYRMRATRREDLNTSGFHGVGHRKAWARLRLRVGVKVGRRGVLRLKQENNLLSSDRGWRSNPHRREGEIITQGPNLMWGTIGARVYRKDNQILPFLV